MTNSASGVKVAHRTAFQKFFLDPLTGITIILFYFLFWILPVDVSSWIGEKLSYPLSWILHKKNKTALYNLKKCFPQKTEEERRQIARNMWKHFGRMMGEIPHINRIKKDRIEIIGKEYIDEMGKDKIGGFVVSAHIGNWELSSSIGEQIGMPLHLVYRMANNPWVEKYIYQRRKMKDVELIPKGASGARRMIEIIKAGGHIGLLCDQKMREGIDVPFFGYPAKTASAVATLALKFNVPIYLGRSVRMQGVHFQNIYYPALSVPRSGNKEQDVLAIMTEINRAYERWITQHPEQWLWMHHRWDKKEYPHG